MHHLSLRQTIGMVCLVIAAAVGSLPQPQLSYAALGATFDPASVCPYAAAPSYSSSPASTPEAFEAEVVRLVNLERTQHGLWPLTSNTILNAVARAHSSDMAVRGYFSHSAPEGTRPAQRAKQAGYPVYGWGDAFVGENIAGGQALPAKAMAGWMTSPGHCQSILNPNYREIGVGYFTSTSSQWRHYWTMNVGSAPLVLPIQINGGASSTSSRDVRVHLTDETVSAWGSLGLVSAFQISEDPSFVGAAWQPFPANPPTASFQLSAGAGLKTVYVRYRDGEGRLAVASTRIQLDAAPTSPGKLTLLHSPDGRPLQAQVSYNGDGGNWSISDDASWLTLSPTSGSGPLRFTITVDPAALGVGTHSATLTIVSEGSGPAVQATSTLPVQLVISENIQSVYVPMLARP